MCLCLFVHQASILCFKVRLFVCFPPSSFVVYTFIKNTNDRSGFELKEHKAQFFVCFCFCLFLMLIMRFVVCVCCSCFCCLAATLLSPMPGVLISLFAGLQLFAVVGCCCFVYFSFVVLLVCWLRGTFV